MFIDEIEKDEIGYVNKAKEKVKEYFLEFFDEKYKDQIEHRLKNTPLVFVEKNHAKMPDTFFSSRINIEINFLYKTWIRKCFSDIDLNCEVNDIKIFEEFLYSDINEFYDKLNNKFQIITNSDKNITKKQINSCKKIFENEFEEKINELSFLKLKMLEDNKNASLINSTEELKQNKFIKQFYDDINEIEKSILLRSYNNFIDLSLGNGSLIGHVKTSFKNSEFSASKFYYILYKDSRITFLQTFVHELIHAISSSFEVIDNNEYSFILEKCGIEEKKSSLLMQGKKDIKNMLINEILTDYFAFLITQKMQQNGDEFFLSSLNNSSYSQCFVLVKPLMDKYLDKFKDCFMSKTSCGMQNLIGEQNLNNLNTLVEDFLGYCNYLRTNKLGLAHNFEEGLKEAKKPESLYVNQVVTKYNKCFLRMENLMKNIDEHINNKDNAFLKTN